jgi:phosphate transport system protein
LNAEEIEMARLFDPILAGLRETLLRMGSRSEAILEKSLRSVWRRDSQLAQQVAGDDIEIDRLDVEIDDKVLKALALQAPVAGDLREVVAVKMIANDLERIGDIARDIALCGARLSLHPRTPIDERLTRMAHDTQEVLRMALDSFSNANADAARAVLDRDDAIDAAEDDIIRAAMANLTGNPEEASETVDAILIAKNLERVGDHATNIAEGVILISEARNVKHAAKLGNPGARRGGAGA